MKQLFIIFALNLFFLGLKAQSEFQTAWYIIQNNARYSVIQPGYSDVLTDKGKLRDVDNNELISDPGEPVLAFSLKNDNIFCFDPLGRLLIFKSQGLKKAPTPPGSGVGVLLKDIEVLSSDDLKLGSYVWIVGQDISRNTLKIMVNDEKEIEIPRDVVQLITKQLETISKEVVFKVAQH